MAPEADETVDVAIVGAGPCGLAAAITMLRARPELSRVRRRRRHEHDHAYPTYVNFFSTAEKLSLGGLPFTIGGDKPGRRDALAYYRSVVTYFGIPVRQYERVTEITGSEGELRRSHACDAAATCAPSRARFVIIATGYFGSPNRLNVPGETLEHVTHVYKEGHEAFDQDTVVVGGGNSAAEAALDLWRCGARVTLVHFGPDLRHEDQALDPSGFQNRMKEGNIARSMEQSRARDRARTASRSTRRARARRCPRIACTS